MNSSRLGLAASRYGHMPRVLSLINVNYKTPMPNLIWGVVTSIILVTSNSIFDLMVYTTYIGNVVSTASLSILIMKRFTEPDLERPFKVPLALPVVILLLSFMQLVFPFINRPVKTIVSLVVIISGIPVYYLLVVGENKPVWIHRLEMKATRGLQKLMVSVPEEHDVTSEKASYGAMENAAFSKEE